MPKPLPRNHASLEPKRPPKRTCSRGHLLRRVGWVLQPCSGRQAGYYVRRCKACLRDDVDNHKRGKMRNEKTSARIARLAGKILAIKREPAPNDWWPSWVAIRTLAASCLTQTADKRRKRSATKRLRPYTVDAASIPEMDAGFGPKPRRKAKRKTRK